ncbi:nitroreductase [Lachnospiraceae bacterium PF1-22]|uniref:nitroreductase family protein n=1 Tax=Ohessyouella blattaphilus TaxID=2949333 RepID=UPI003E224F48
METNVCIKERRSVRQFKDQTIDHDTLSSIIQVAAFAPSWKNSQIVRYLAIEDSYILSKIKETALPSFNARIVETASTLVALTFIKGRSGYERDGSFSTTRENKWENFDAGIAAATFCLAAKDAGLGTVIMGIYDEDKVAELINLPEDREIAALIAIGYPDESPQAPKRKTADELLTFI